VADDQISAEQYDSWSEEQSADVEIVDGMVVPRPAPLKRHNLIATRIAVALEAASGGDWRTVTNVDLRLRDVPLLNRRPDVIVFRPDTMDVTPTRPEHVLMVVEVVSSGSETTDRVVKPDQYAKAGIQFYWRVEPEPAGGPLVYTYTLDRSSGAYRDGDVFTGVVTAIAPFPATIDLATI
jgi:Uma2 family endonuclease